MTMDRQDLHDFLYFMVHNRNLNRGQKSKINRLLESSIITVTTNSKSGNDTGDIDNKRVIYHSPHKMIEFLSLFSRDDRFKWYTHKWDDSDSSKLTKLKEHQAEDKKVLIEMAYPKEDGYAVNEATYNQVWNFVNFNTQSDYPWKNNKSNDIRIGWRSIIPLCEKNKEMPVEKLGFNDGHLFIDYIRMFKAVIEFRTDLAYDDRFGVLISRSIRDRLPADFNFNISGRFRKTGNYVNVYCDVAGLLEGLHIICQWITSFKSVSSKVGIDLIEETDYYILEILHCESYFTNIEKLKGLSGDFDKLRKRLFSVCDFKMEGDYFKGGEKSGSLKVCGLDVNTKLIINKQGKDAIKTLTPCTIMESSDKIGGVKYQFKIYKQR